MAEIRIDREHALGMPRARKIAAQWMAQVESEYGMSCELTKGRSHDVVTFRRTGVHGELHVGKDHFALTAKLGLLVGVFKSQIENEIIQRLDDLLQE